MTGTALYKAMGLFWPALRERTTEAEFAAAWGPEVARIPEADGIAVVRAIAREVKWAPSLAEFLLAARQYRGESPPTQSEARYPCAGKALGCTFAVRGAGKIAAHERTCAQAKAQREADAAAVAAKMEAWRQRKTEAPSDVPVGDVLAGMRKGTA